MRRIVLAFLLAFGLALGGGAIPAHAYCVGSSLCSPANAPLLATLDGTLAPASVTAVSTGSAATTPLAITAGTSAGGSTIAAEVWGGLAAVGLSAAGWLTANAMLSETDLPSGEGTDNDLDVINKVLWFKSTGQSSQVNLTMHVSYAGSYGGPPAAVTISHAGGLTNSGFASSGQIQLRAKCDHATYPATYSNGTLFTSTKLSSGGSSAWTPSTMQTSCVKSLQVRVPELWSFTAPNSVTVEQWSPWFDVPIPGTPAQAMYTLETQLDCTGSGTHVYTSAPFASAPLEGVVLPERLCPAPEHVTGVRIWLRVDGSPALDRKLLDITVPDYVQKVVPDNCLETGAECELDLRRDGQSITGNATEANWESKAGDYTCHYGGRQVALEFCRAAYGATPRNQEGVETTPVPTPIPVPFPYPAPAPPFPELGDPITEPGVEPGTDANSCLRWSLGDILTGVIVFRAAACAMEWAFAPTPGTWQATQSVMQGAWTSSGPAVFYYQGANILGDTADELGDMMNGNCSGPAVTLPNYGEIRPLNACNEPVATVAAWTRLGSTVLFAAWGVMTSIRVVLGALNISVPWGKASSSESTVDA